MTCEKEQNTRVRLNFRKNLGRKGNPLGLMFVVRVFSPPPLLVCLFNFGKGSVDCSRRFKMDTTSSNLGLAIQWLALTGLAVHLWALGWGLWACCRRREVCPFAPSTRVEAGRMWAWRQQHPRAPSPPCYEGPRRRQSGGQGLAGLIRRQDPAPDNVVTKGKKGSKGQKGAGR